MINYLKEARAKARRAYNALGADPEYNSCHDSFRAVKALQEAESFLRSKGENGTFGVEGFTEHGGCEYLNTGESYEPTVCYRKGRFIIASWGDIVERSAE